MGEPSSEMSFKGIALTVRVICLTLFSINEARGQCDAATRPLTVTLSGPIYISTPNWPGTYDPNSDCAWVVEGNGAGQRVVANIEYANMTGCSYDYGELYDGADDSASRLALFCENDVDEFLSTGNNLYLTFISSPIVQYTGFNILFFSVDSAHQRTCGTRLPDATTAEQFVLSPNMPGVYDSSYTCTYTIYPTFQYSDINITIYFMDIQSSSNCRKDKLSISAYANGALTEIFSGCSRAATTSWTIPDVVGDYGEITFSTDSGSTNFYGYLLSYAQLFKGMNISFPATLDDPNNAIQLNVPEAEPVGDVDASVAYVSIIYTGTLSIDVTDANTGGAVPFDMTLSTASRYNLQYSSQLDWESGVTSYNIAVTMTSSDVTQLTSTVYYDITVSAVDDIAPNITNLPATVTVYRTELMGYEVFTVNTTDSDIGIGSAFTLTISNDVSGVLSIDTSTGLITLAQNMDVVSGGITYVVDIVAQGVSLQTTESLSIYIPPDSPPVCTHTMVYTEPLDSLADGAGKYVDYTEEWSCWDDNIVITYSIASVTPTLTTPLFGIESDTGELYLLRTFTLDESGSDHTFIVETLATDSLPQSKTIVQYLNATGFNCYPNPRFLYVGMDNDPDTVLLTDFNCTTGNLGFSVLRQYPSNTFEMQTSADGSYALIQKELVYQIRFYSLYLLMTDGTDYVTLKFNVVIQTYYCAPEDVS